MPDDWSFVTATAFGIVLLVLWMWLGPVPAIVAAVAVTWMILLDLWHTLCDIRDRLEDDDDE